MQADTQWCHETSRGSISNSVPVKPAARPACVQASPPPRVCRIWRGHVDQIIVWPDLHEGTEMPADILIPYWIQKRLFINRGFQKRRPVAVLLELSFADKLEGNYRLFLPADWCLTMENNLREKHFSPISVHAMTHAFQQKSSHYFQVRLVLVEICCLILSAINL